MLAVAALLGCEKKSAEQPPPAPAPALAPPIDALALDAVVPADAAASITGPCGKLALGETAECAVAADGTASCVGDGREGKQVSGVGSVASVDQLDVGYAHACARSGAAVSCWGYGELGQLGNGGKTSRTPVALSLPNVVDVDVGHVSSCARTSDGAVTCWGMLGTASEPALDRKLTRVSLASAAIDLDAGGANGCAVLADGGVQCWGKPTSVVTVAGVPAARAVAIGSQACAITQADELWCWDPAVRKPTAKRASVAAVAQASGSCVLNRSGEVWCDGYPFACPPTTRGAARPVVRAGYVKVPFASSVSALYTGPNVVCGQASDGSVECQGCRATGAFSAKPTPLTTWPTIGSCP